MKNSTLGNQTPSVILGAMALLWAVPALTIHSQT